MVTGNAWKAAVPATFIDGEFLFVRVGVGAEGGGGVVEFDGAVGFLSGDRTCLRLFGGESGDFLRVRLCRWR